MVEWGPIGFPSSLDSFTDLSNDTDDVLANHPNTLADAVEVLQAKVGINGSAVLSSLDYKSVHSSYRIPVMRYESTSSIRVTTASGEMSSMYIPLNDGIFREADSDELLFDFSTGVGDLGLDTGSEASSTWYYLYGVPKTGDNTKYTVVASVSDPDIGPTDRDAYRYFGAFRNDGSSNIIKFFQSMSRFYFITRQELINNTGVEASPVALDISSACPPTASLAILSHTGHPPGNSWWGDLYLFIDGQQGGGLAACFTKLAVFINWQSNTIVLDMPVTNNRQIWYRRVMGVGTNLLYIAEGQGWVDRYL